MRTPSFQRRDARREPRGIPSVVSLLMCFVGGVAFACALAAGVGVRQPDAGGKAPFVESASIKKLIVQDLRLVDSNGKQRAWLTTNERGDTEFVVLSETGIPRAFILAGKEKLDIQVYDATARPRIVYRNDSQISHVYLIDTVVNPKDDE